MNIDWSDFESLSAEEIVSNYNADELSNRKHFLEYSVQLDDIVRRDMIKRCHALEAKFMKLVPAFDCMISDLHDACATRFARLKDKGTSPLQGIDKLAIGFNSGEMIKKGRAAASLKKTIFDSIVKMQELYELMSRDDIGNELLIESVCINHNTMFNDICWHHNIRGLFYARLSRNLNTWNKLVRRLSHRIKKAKNVSRINEYEYKDFLENFDAYDLDPETKSTIIREIGDYAKNIGDCLEVDFFERKSDVMGIMSLYSEYVDVKNEILLSVMKYPAYLCSRQKHYLSTELVSSVVSRSIEQISKIIYKYDNEHNFMNFVHGYCQNAISQARLESKMVVNNMELENKRKAIYSALKEVEDFDGNIDFKVLAEKVSELDPKAVFDPKALESYINGAHVKSLDSSAMSDDFYHDEPNDGLFDEDTSVENELMSEEFVEFIQEALEILPDVQRDILSTHLWGDTEEQKLVNIAKEHQLTYDQTRGVLDKARKRVALYVKEKLDIDDDGY